MRMCYKRSNITDGQSLTSLVSHTSTPSGYMTSSFWLPLPGAKRIFFTQPWCVGTPLKKHPTIRFTYPIRSTVPPIHELKESFYLDIRALRSQKLRFPSTSPSTKVSPFQAMHAMLPILPCSRGKNKGNDSEIRYIQGAEQFRDSVTRENTKQN